MSESKIIAGTRVRSRVEVTRTGYHVGTGATGLVCRVDHVDTLSVPYLVSFPHPDEWVWCRADELEVLR